MKINYQETTSDLATRIDIHNQYGGRDIDKWMLEILPLKQGMKILDVACGAGKQCTSFNNHLKGACNIIGGDVSADLLAQAQQRNEEIGTPFTLMELNFNQRFPFVENQFDLTSCCFAIYYAEDIPFTIREMHRVLKPGGVLFSTGPMPENKQLFYDIIHEATQKPIPPMPGSSRYASSILASMKETFKQVEVLTFENPLTFESAEPFLAYTRASLSEDRKLWNDLFTDKTGFEHVMSQISQVAQTRIEKEGKLVMTKVVGGFIATK